jgi:hypothetical protein
VSLLGQRGQGLEAAGLVHSNLAQHLAIQLHVQLGG